MISYVIVCKLAFCVSRDDSIYNGNASVTSTWRYSWAATKSVIKVQTFQIIVLQGIIGSLPWTAMVFFTMWFELIGEHEAFFSILTCQCNFAKLYSKITSTTVIARTQLRFLTFVVVQRYHVRFESANYFSLQ